MAKKALKQNLGPIPLKDFLDANNVSRSVAILLVILAHVKFADSFWMHLGPVTSAGKLGVSIFVFYSGLLLEFQAKQAGTHFNAWDWMKRRVLRIYPLYWIGLLLTIMVGGTVNAKHYDFWTILTNAVGIPLLIKQPIVTSGYAKPYWFISLILFCYLLFIALKNTRQKGYLAIGSMIFSLFAIYFGRESFFNQVEYYLALLAFPMFFWGMWIMDRFLDGNSIPGNRTSHCISAILLFGMTAFIFKCSHLINMNKIWAEMLGLVFLNITTIYLCCCITYLFQLLKTHALGLLKSVNLVGAVSFAIYCIHEPLLVLLEKSSDLEHPIIRFQLYLVITFLISWYLSVSSGKIMTISCTTLRSAGK